VDLGATLSKLAICDAEGELHFESIPTDDLERVEERIEALGPRNIGLTGGGASRLAERLGSACTRTDEFTAWGAGARRLLEADALAGDTRNLLVSLGTGTSILLMDGENTMRVGGTALGGGTVIGLAGALLGTNEFNEVRRLAQNGDRAQVDLVVKDIYRPGEIPLDDELTAASFGKLGHPSMTPESKRPENLAAAIMGLVGENVGLICAGLSYATQVQRVVYAGSTLHDNGYLRSVLHSITSNAGRTPVFLPHGEYGGATGALVLASPTA
jgi:type II pantothenate kinase